MNFFSQYGLFLLETLTILIALLICIGLIIALLLKNKNMDPDGIRIRSLNEKYQDLKTEMQKEILPKDEFKLAQKLEKKKQKNELDKKQPRTFVIDFKGDLKVSNIENFRNEITAVLSVAEQSDEVVVLIESPGGMVAQYGLAASQLARVRDRKIPLTVCVDKVAASGGYMMACVANKILCAPFAFIGSIGVVAQLPNFNRFLKKQNIDFEQITAGQYKRTLTVFGENTDEARIKFKQDLEVIHQQFQDHIQEFRPSCDLAQVATGEHWLGRRAQELHLVDSLITSDDYLQERSQHTALYQIQYVTKQKFMQKLTGSVHGWLMSFM